MKLSPSNFERRRAQFLALQEEAVETDFSEVDIPAFIEKGITKAQSLPDDNTNKAMILKSLYAARTALGCNNEKAAKINLCRAVKLVQFENDQDWLNGVEKQFGKATESRKAQLRDQKEAQETAWQRKADEIRSNAPRKMSKREIAIKVAKHFPASHETIRKAIQ